MRPSTPPRRRALLLLVGLLAAAELTTGVAAAVDQRADQAHARHVAQEKRAAAAYRTALHPLLLRVFDAVQPLQDVIDAYATPRPGLTAARDDVFSRSKAAAELRSVRTALKAVPAPATYRTAAPALEQALGQLIKAADDLSSATHAKADRNGVIKALQRSGDELFDAETEWGIKVALVDTALLVPVPQADRALAHGRKAPSLGRFIQVSDLACAKAFADQNRVPRLNTLAAARAGLPRLATILRTSAVQLRAVRLPASSKAAQHRLDVQLRGVTEAAAAIDALVRASRKGGTDALIKALQRFEDSFDQFQALSTSYRDLGVTVCAAFFRDDPKPSRSSGNLAA